MTREEYIALYEKLLAGNCTEEERRLVMEYSDDFELKDHSWTTQMGDKEQVRNEIYNRLQFSTSLKKKSVIPLITKITVAAAAISVVLLTVLYVTKPGGEQQRNDTVAASEKTIAPGGNRATLVLADGSTIILDSVANGTLVKQGNVEVKKNSDGQLVYYLSADNHPSENGSGLNTISTPVGGQYQVRLEDGTNVWLNAASSIRFPAVFTEGERVVEITGEAYFEVARNTAKPFRVSFNGNTVTVLGTHFNIMAYKEEEDARVSLLEGSVRVGNNKENKLLEPGKQAVIKNNDSKIITREANMEEAIAWKNGYFIFDNENIHGIMRKIARWYNVQYEFKGEMKGKEFTGTISKFKDVSEIFGMLEETESIHFNINGDKITITP